MAELTFEHQGVWYTAQAEASDDGVLIKLIYTSGGGAVTLSNKMLKSLMNCLEVLMPQNGDMYAQIAHPKNEAGTPQISIVVDKKSHAWQARETLVYTGLNTVIESGFDADKLSQKMFSKSSSAKATPEPSARIDSAKLKRAADAVYEGLGEVIPAGQSYVCYAAFIYNMSLLPTPNLREEAAKFLADNRYTSSDSQVNKALTDGMITVAENFIAAEQKQMVR
jgi:hypothetical protein